MFRKIAFSSLLAVGFAVALAACSGSAPKQPVTITVTAKDFSFEASQTTFQVGVPYHFVVTNKGTVQHEFMIIKPEPAGTDSTQLDSEAIVHIEEDDLNPGETHSIDYTFTKPYPSGTLEIACHMPGHYENGMHLPIEVK